MTGPDRRHAFTEAARWFVDITAAARGRYDDPGLGEWTVRDLVGHTSRALLTVEGYLTDLPGPVQLASPVAYFGAVAAGLADPAAVAQRGRDAGVALGDDPDSSVQRIAQRVLALLHAAPDDAVVATPVGRIRLLDYLPTRTFELTVHTCDLAAALALEAVVPERAATEAMALAGGAAARQGTAAPLLLASTGRRALPAGFTVV